MKDRKEMILAMDEAAMDGPVKISLPPSEPPTSEELARRDRAVQELLRLREKIGPIDLTLEEFLAGDRIEDE